MIRSMEGFFFSLELDLSMGYYHIKIDADAQNYLSLYWITRQGIQSIRYKVEMNAILNIKAPKTRKAQKIRQFIGIVNYYRNMWFRRSELLARFH
jgi:hypothetical protein